MKEILLTTSC